jgi:hypothetical protein
MLPMLASVLSPSKSRFAVAQPTQTLFAILHFVRLLLNIRTNALIGIKKALDWL